MPQVKHLIIAILLGVMVLTPFSVSAKLPKVLASVQPLYDRTGAICTVWSINERQGLWAGSAHCYAPEDDFYRTIAGQPVTIVKVSYELDLALVSSPIHAPALKLGNPVKVGQEITIYGYPLGWQIPVATWGYISWLYFPQGWAVDWPYDNMVMDIRSLPGHSGSPVIDDKGKVVSVLQGTVSIGAGGISLGVPWHIIRAFYAGVWES